MARKEISNLWDRDMRIAIDENFKELYNEYTQAGLDAKDARNKAVQAVADSLEAKQTANVTREEMLAIIREQTQNGDLAPEIAQARGSESTLGGRLNSFDSNLAENESYVKRKEIDIWDFLEYVPMHNTLVRDQWDWTEAIKQALIRLKNIKGKLIFPPGIYIHGDGVINKKPSGYTLSGTYNDGTGDFPNYTPDDGIGYSYYVKNGLNIPYGETRIGENRRFWADGLEDVEIEGYGAVIKAHGDNACIVDNAGFVFIRCKNVKIKGLMYDGSIAERAPFLNDAGGFNFQHGFAISDDCKDVTFEDVSSNRCVMDGFNIHRRVENIRLINCSAYENYRQGGTIGNSLNITVEGGEYSRTGTIYGTAPMAGIDVEVWEDTGAVSLTFKKITFRGNVGRGLYLHSGTQSSTVEECLFDKNELAEDERNTWNNTIKNNTFINTAVVAHGGGTYVDDNKFYYDGSVSGTYRPSITNDDTDKKFQKGISRRGRVKGNYVHCDLTNVSEDVTVLGAIAGIDPFNTDVTDNVLINAFSTTGTGVINGTPRTFARNTIIYNGPLTNPGRVHGGVSNYDNEVSPTYSKLSSYPYDLESTPSLESDVSDTGNVTTQHNRAVLASENSQSSVKGSTVISSVLSKVTGSFASVISSGVDSSVSYPVENTGSNSLILASRAVKNNEPYVIVGGHRGTASPGTAQTADRKWKINSVNGDIHHSGAIQSGHAFSDFAELFPNLTGKEQGNGLIQTLDGYGVRPAQNGEKIIGVTSATAGLILGDTPFSWQGRWLKDEFGAYIYKDVYDEELEKMVKVPKENPEYVYDQDHLPRKERPGEWSIVGLIGQVYVRVTEDVNPMDYIKAYQDGIGTASQEVTNLQAMKITTPYNKDNGYAVAFCIIR